MADAAAKAREYPKPPMMVRTVDNRDTAEKFLGLGSDATRIAEAEPFRIIMRGHRTKPQARVFQDRVTRSILPGIRKDCGYVMGEETVATGEMSKDALIVKAMTAFEGKVTRLT